MKTQQNISVNSTGKQRITWIDSLKGFTILTVVLGHLVMTYYDAGEFESHKNILLAIYNLIYSFHMPLFFMISGFVVSLAYIGADGETKKDKILRQIGNISIIYIFWNSMSCLARVIFSGKVHHGATVTDLLWFPVKAVDPFWYLYVLLFCYLLSMICTKKQFTSPASYVIAFIGCLFYRQIFDLISGITIARLFAYYFFFAFGILLFRIPDILDVLSKPVFIITNFAIGIVLILLYVAGADKTTPWSSAFFWGIIMALSLSVAIFGLAKLLSKFNLPLKKGFFAWIGRYSLEIYAIHCFLITIDRIILKKFHFIGFTANLAINFIISAFIPILAAVILKKLKLHGIFFAPVTWFKNLKTNKEK